MCPFRADWPRALFARLARLSVAAAILMASVGAVAADERFPPNQFYGPYENNGHFVKPSQDLPRRGRIAMPSIARERVAAKVWALARYVPKVRAMYRIEA